METLCSNITSTLYAYDDSTFLATIDTPSITVGTTTTAGTSTTYYIHPDNLGSTQATSNADGNFSQYFDYTPYGSVLASTTTDPTANIARQYIGQFTDPTGLSYLNARYYNAAQEQFLSEDPIFLGSPSQQNLEDPQSLNPYSYAEDNPITNEDPTGKWFQQYLTGQQSWPSFQLELGDAANTLAQESPVWNFAFNHPYTTGLTIIGPLSAIAAASGVSAVAAFSAAAYPGVGASYAVSQIAAGSIYSALTYDSLSNVKTLISKENQIDLSNPNTALSAAGTFAYQVGPSLAGEYIGAISDAAQIGSMFAHEISSLFNTNLSSFIHPSSSSHSNSVSSTQGSTSSRASALYGVVNAFTPSNSVQAQAVQNVISAFSK